MTNSRCQSKIEAEGVISVVNKVSVISSSEGNINKTHSERFESLEVYCCLYGMSGMDSTLQYVTFHVS